MFQMVQAYTIKAYPINNERAFSRRTKKPNIVSIYDYEYWITSACRIQLHSIHTETTWLDYGVGSNNFTLFHCVHHWAKKTDLQFSIQMLQLNVYKIKTYILN